MQLTLSNDLQVHIANLLWAAQEAAEVKKILATYGKEAQVVYNMLLAEVFDTMTETDIASDVLREIFKGQ